MSAFGAYAIVGFDLRLGPVMDFGSPRPLGEHAPDDIPRGPPYPPTITRSLWPRSPKLDHLAHPRLNGLNLMWLPDGGIAQRSGITVAFSMNTQDAQTIRNSSWLLDIDEALLDPALGWRLLGHDIVDDMLAYSAFYGFTWKPGELAALLNGLSFRFNRYGLIEEEQSADEIAARFTEQLESSGHAPFRPLRVWIQSRTTNT